MKEENKDLKPINISDKELQRDIINLNLEEPCLLDGILMTDEELYKRYDQEFIDWIKNGRLDEPEEEDSK